MNYKTNLKRLIIASSLVMMTNMSYAEQYKRFSVSAGWMHVMPQGKANPFNINTKVNPTQKYAVGEISQNAFLNSVSSSALMDDGAGNGGTMPAKEFLEQIFALDSMGSGSSLASFLGLLTDNGDQTSPVNSNASGGAILSGIDQWKAQGTGLEAEDVDTLGITLNYYLNDHVSIQFIGGIPPKVDIKGKGEIIANMKGVAFPDENNVIGVKDLFLSTGLDLQQDIPITNLGNKNKASSVRAWTPALEVQYQFGKTGINKFRPFVGAGIMYAHFNEIELDHSIEADLKAAGHMIQNILDGKGGAALEGKISSADPQIRVKTTDAIAPLFTLGATYDLNSEWYGIASVSYAKLNNRATIDVINKNDGNELIHSSTKIDIDPLITYVGIGYRF